MNTNTSGLIDSRLLGDNDPMPWSNLGLWQHPQDSYPVAAQQLALQLARQMGLTSAKSILDVGCGYGASLALWQRLGVSHITAIERQAACVQAWPTHSGLTALHAHMHDLHRLVPAASIDAVIAIDVAYQWSLPRWLAQARHVLVPDGGLGFHFLLRSPLWPHLPARQRLLVRTLLRFVGLHTLWTTAQLQAALQPHWHTVHLTDLSQPVLQGFAQYARQLPSGKPSRQRALIGLTGHLCGLLARTGAVSYVAVSTRKRV